MKALKSGKFSYTIRIYGITISWSNADPYNKAYEGLNVIRGYRFYYLQQNGIGISF